MSASLQISAPMPLRRTLIPELSVQDPLHKENRDREILENCRPHISLTERKATKSKAMGNTEAETLPFTAEAELKQNANS